jgi:hypothetical protein
LQRRLRVTYYFFSPDWVPLLPAPEAEPGPPELGTAPELPGVGVAPELPGVGVLLEPVPPALEPLPVVMPSSFRHFSRSVPTMPRHLLLVLPEAPLELLPVALGEVLLGEVLLGELLLGVLLLPVAPLELLPVAPLSEELLPVAPALLPVLPPPMPPDDEPVLCASVTLESARSAAAVAALMSFNVMSVFLPYLLVPDAPPLLPEPMPDPLVPAPELGSFGVLLPDAPLLGVLLLVPLLGVLLLVPPPEAAPEPDFLKCASHSSREICPSLFLSTDEKLGVCELAPLEAPAFGALEVPPEALSGDLLSVAPALEPEDLLSVAPALEPGALLSVAAALEPEDLLSAAPAPVLCACATPASAKSAAAVAVPTTLNNMEIPPRRGLGRLQRE